MGQVSAFFAALTTRKLRFLVPTKAVCHRLPWLAGLATVRVLGYPMALINAKDEGLGNVYREGLGKRMKPWVVLDHEQVSKISFLRFFWPPVG